MKNTYDILIIGAGLGGLECAYILSKSGYKVCVLEKNQNIGGTLQNFLHGDCTFSSGMHYLGSLDEGQVLNKLFRYFNILDDLDLKRMDPNGFDRFYIGSKEYAYPMGWNFFEEKMSIYFPKEKEAIRTYVKLMQKVAASQDVYNLRPYKGNDIRLNEYLKTGIYPAIERITKNRDLQGALCALNFVYAGDQYTSSLYTHALINNYYIQSAYRLNGGSGQIADLLAKNIQINGGEIHVRKEVDQFVFKGDQLAGIITKSKEIFTANHIISNVHPAATLKMIEDGKLRKSFRKRLTNIPDTISVFGVHMNIKPNTFPAMNYNYYYYKNNDVWAVSGYDEKKWPEFYYLYTPSVAIENTYTSCISIYSYMQYDEVKKWADTTNDNRGPDYGEWKKRKAEKLINLASQRFPVLNTSIVDYTTVTPLTYRDYIGTPKGGMYGTLRDYHNPMASYVFPRTKIPNLYFTGQNINLHGMLGVSISSLMTCGEFLGLNNLIKEVNES